jgi:hypothetical protein
MYKNKNSVIKLDLKHIFLHQFIELVHHLLFLRMYSINKFT